jgi:hypothetical protein
VKIKELKDIDLLQIGHTIQISGMMMSDGDGKTYLIPLPGELIGTLIGLNLSFEDWKKFLRQSDIQEVEVLANDEGKLKKAIIRKSTRQIDQKVSWNVYRRDDYACRYCGRDDIPLTVDHIVLWEEGGPSIEENLVTSCKRCNKTRGNIQYKDWVVSDQYYDLSKNLSGFAIRLNLALIDTLDAIPRKVHVKIRTSSKDRKKKQRHGIGGGR